MSVIRQASRCGLALEGVTLKPHPASFREKGVLSVYISCGTVVAG